MGPRPKRMRPSRSSPSRRPRPPPTQLGQVLTLDHGGETGRITLPLIGVPLVGASLLIWRRVPEDEGEQQP